MSVINSLLCWSSRLSVLRSKGLVLKGRQLVVSCRFCEYSTEENSNGDLVHDLEEPSEVFSDNKESSRGRGRIRRLRTSDKYTGELNVKGHEFKDPRERFSSSEAFGGSQTDNPVFLRKNVKFEPKQTNFPADDSVPFELKDVTFEQDVSRKETSRKEPNDVWSKSSGSKFDIDGNGKLGMANKVGRFDRFSGQNARSKFRSKDLWNDWKSGKFDNANETGAGSLVDFENKYEDGEISDDIEEINDFGELVSGAKGRFDEKRYGRRNLREKFRTKEIWNERNSDKRFDGDEESLPGLNDRFDKNDILNRQNHVRGKFRSKELWSEWKSDKKFDDVDGDNDESLLGLKRRSNEGKNNMFERPSSRSKRKLTSGDSFDDVGSDRKFDQQKKFSFRKNDPDSCTLPDALHGRSVKNNFVAWENWEELGERKQKIERKSPHRSDNYETQGDSVVQYPKFIVHNREGRTSKRHENKERENDIYKRGKATREMQFWKARLDTDSKLPKIVTEGREILYGLHPVIMAMKEKKRRFHKIYLKKGQKDSTLTNKVLPLAERLNIETEIMAASSLLELSGNRPHQGVCLEVDPLQVPMFDIENFRGCSASEPEVWVLPMQVMDPMNLGSLLRTSYFLGVKRILLTNKNSCKPNPIVSKASSGAMEVMNISMIKNLTHILELCELWKQNGGKVVGMSAHSHKDTDTMEAHSYLATGSVLLIAGNEMRGIREEVLDVCDSLVTISSGTGVQPDVDSLNVSVASGIVLYNLMTNNPSLRGATSVTHPASDLTVNSASSKEAAEASFDHTVLEDFVGKSEEICEQTESSHSLKCDNDANLMSPGSGNSGNDVNIKRQNEAEDIGRKILSLNFLKTQTTTEIMSQSENSVIDVHSSHTVSSTPYKASDKKRNREPSDSSFEQSSSNNKHQDRRNTSKQADKKPKHDKDRNQTKLDKFTCAGTADKPSETQLNMTMINKLDQMEALLKQVVTKDDIEKKMENMVTTSEFKNIITKMKDDFHSQTKEMFEQLTGRIHSLEVENETLHKEIERITKNANVNENNIVALNHRLEIEKRKNNDLEQYERANSIRISGLQDKDAENMSDTIKEVVKLCNHKLQIRVEPNDIDIAHRLGRFIAGKSRNVICKFVRRTTKVQVITKRNLLKGTGIVIRDDVTQQNQQLLTEAFKHPKIISTWSYNGKIMVKFENEMVRQIHSLKDIDTIVSQHSDLRV